jgi:uncharacterized protein YkwD
MMVRAMLAMLALAACAAMAHGEETRKVVTQTTEYSYSGGSAGGFAGASAGGSAGMEASLVSHRGGLKKLFQRRKASRQQTSQGQQHATQQKSESAPRVKAACGCCDKCTGKPGCDCGCESCKCNYASPPRSHGASIDLSPEESSMLGHLTAFRQRHGLPEMAVDPLLERVARKRVAVYNHQAFGMWSWQHAHREGFPGPELNTTVTDNLSLGYSAADAIDGWANTTDGHADQMLGKAKMNGQWQDCHFNVCGLAHQGGKSIGIFGRR